MHKMLRTPSSFDTDDSRDTVCTRMSTQSSMSQLRPRTGELRPLSPASTVPSDDSNAIEGSYHNAPIPVDFEDCDCPADEHAHETEEDFVFGGISDNVPTPAELEEARNIRLYDADGLSRRFKSLYSGQDRMGQRQLIVFVRHFYCPACQAYVKKLSTTFTPSTCANIPIPTQIIIISCGAPHLIPRYITRTNSMFQVYTDPTRRLYKILGMPLTIRPGPNPEYTDKKAGVKIVMTSILQMASSPLSHFAKGGNIIQVGGEFLFEDGRPVWCHRMRNLRDHSEINVLKSVLEMDQDKVTAVGEAEQDNSSIIGDGLCTLLIDDDDSEVLREDKQHRTPSTLQQSSPLRPTSRRSNSALNLLRPESSGRTRSVGRRRKNSLFDEEETRIMTTAMAGLSTRTSGAISRQASALQSSRNSLMRSTSAGGLNVIVDNVGHAYLSRDSRLSPV